MEAATRPAMELGWGLERPLTGRAASPGTIEQRETSSPRDPVARPPLVSAGGSL